MAHEAEAVIAGFMADSALPPEYAEIIRRYWLPLAKRLADLHRDEPLLVGINGAQGTGKSTMSASLARLLEDLFGLSTQVLSIDDLYLTRAERMSLAESVHPLLAMRGVPGTHDIGLGIGVIEALKGAGAQSETAVPRFDKGVDDRLPRQAWPLHRGRADIILLEGWCVGTPPQAETELNEPVNALEADEDGDGSWRTYINRALAGDYRRLFAMIDYLILLKAPDFSAVYHWRGKQEGMLARERPDASVMDVAQLARFISHYERLTRHSLSVLPALADAVFEFDENHAVVRACYRSEQP